MQRVRLYAKTRLGFVSRTSGGARTLVHGSRAGTGGGMDHETRNSRCRAGPPPYASKKRLSGVETPGRSDSRHPVAIERPRLQSPFEVPSGGGARTLEPRLWPAAATRPLCSVCATRAGVSKCIQMARRAQLRFHGVGWEVPPPHAGAGNPTPHPHAAPVPCIDRDFSPGPYAHSRM